MPIIQYRKYRPSEEGRKWIDLANGLIAEYAADGYSLTLRQLYYRFVAKGWIEENCHANYRKLGAFVTAAREGGLMDWYAIEDRGRNAYFNSYEDDPLNVLGGIEKNLGIDPWTDQDHYLEVWVEKQALEPVIARPARKRRVPYMACKGYLSASEAWRAGLRFEAAIKRGKTPVLLHLGDFDPSGMDMTRDNRDRLEMFARQGVEVRRLALNSDQIAVFKPPPNYAKETDSRHDGFVKTHGKLSYELDALEPREINSVITEAIEGYIDAEKWAASMEREREMRTELALLAPRWDEVRQLVLSHERPLDRLAALDRVVPRLSPLIDQFGGALNAEGLYASAQTRVLAIEAINGLDETTADTPNAQVCVDKTEAVKVVGELRDIPPSDQAVQVRAKTHEVYLDLIDAIQPVPYERPDVEVDNDYEPEDPDELDHEELYGEDD
jgi:hypothetical protein